MSAWEILAKAVNVVDAIVLISTSDWSKRLSDFENVVQTPFKFGIWTLNDTRFCQTDVLMTA